MTEKHIIRFDDMMMDWNPNAPPFSRVWRDALNVRTHDGYLTKRCSLKDVGISMPDMSVNGDSSTEVAQTIYQFGYVSLGLNVTIVVTSRDIWKWDGTNWTSLQLTYETGTASITNGTTSLTGSGTAWSDEHIRDTAVVELPVDSGDWYAIDSVDSNTGITLATNYTGTTLSGSGYKIKRHGGLGSYATAFFNGNLYVAFSGQHDAAGTAGLLAPTLIEVQDALSISPTTRALTSAGGDATSTIDAFDSNTCFPMAILPLATGQIVMPCSPYLASGWEARVYFSDLSDPTVWTSDNGGFYDLVGVTGFIGAAAFLGQQIVCYRQGGVHIGALKGVPDDPISWSNLPGEIGPSRPESLAVVPGGLHVFIDQESLPRSFNGHTSEVLGESLRDRIDLNLASGSYSPRHREYCLSRNEDRYVLSLDRGTWRQEQYAASLRCKTISYLSPLSGGDQAQFLVGASNATGVNLLHYLDESSDADDADDGRSTGAFYAETDDFDLRAAGVDDTREFLVDTVELRAKGREGVSEEITVGVSTNGGVNFYDVTRTITLSADEERTYLFQGFNRGSRPLARIRITLPSSGASAIQISRFLVHVVSYGPTTRRERP